MMNKIFKLLIGILMITIMGCDDAVKPESAPQDMTETSPIGEDVYEKAKDIFYSLPSPVEMTTLIKTSRGVFRKDIILEPQKANDFATLQKQAFALGVYGADLSYAGLFEQKQDAIKLLAATKRIASKVGIEDVFSAEFIERANSNLGNRDSILNILTEVYWETNIALKENNRNELAMLILGAGWVEGVYIGSELINLEDYDTELAERMAEQKYTANQLQALFEKYAVNEIVATAYETFAPLLDAYAALDVSVKSTYTKRDDASGKVIIGGKSEMNFTKEDIRRLVEAARQVRVKLIEV